MPHSQRHKAIALQHSLDQVAPTVVAKGQGQIAQSIVRIANDNGVFVHQSPELVGLLMQVDVDQRIPPVLYLVVAELLSWVYALEAEKIKQQGQPVD